MKIEERVSKSIAVFNVNVAKAEGIELDGAEAEILELAKMYASDAVSWSGKGDYVTAFSGIEYAHGLLDAILKIEEGKRGSP